MAEVGLNKKLMFDRPEISEGSHNIGLVIEAAYQISRGSDW